MNKKLSENAAGKKKEMQKKIKYNKNEKKEVVQLR